MSKTSKLPKFLEAMKEVLQDERSVILTDPELLVAINHKLKRKDKVATSTFEFWKTSTINKKSPENIASLDEEMVEDFRETLAFARVNQKLNLTSEVMNSKNKNQWGSTWILERKFKDLKYQKNAEVATQQPLIQITASNDEHKLLIQSIMNGEPLQLQPKKDEIEPIIYSDYKEVKKSINPLIDNGESL